MSPSVAGRPTRGRARTGARPASASTVGPIPPTAGGALTGCGRVYAGAGSLRMARHCARPAPEVQAARPTGGPGFDRARGARVTFAHLRRPISPRLALVGAPADRRVQPERTA